MTLEGLNEDFRDLLVVLADAGAEFVIVGAYALAFHGVPRASGDIDLFVRPTPENSRRVISALARFGAPLEAAGVTAADFSQPGAVYQIGLPPRRIDVLTQVSGLTFEEAWTSRVAIELEGRTVNFIGRAALLKNKEAAGRPQDIADAARLRRIEPGPEPD
ncbi:MAG: nucleotidyl transferase AbiEii/AbiGii toxin family protein [Candidatus Rokuibacteriota bacterium]